MMYLGPTGSPENHKPDYCSDGVKQAKDGPVWPQPQGIFERGKVFHPLNFLTTLHEVYDTAVVNGSDGGDSAMEYEAFMMMLKDRTIVTADGLRPHDYPGISEQAHCCAGRITLSTNGLSLRRVSIGMPFPSPLSCVCALFLGPIFVLIVVLGPEYIYFYIVVPVSACWHSMSRFGCIGL
jgi:hypothetical protein